MVFFVENSDEYGTEMKSDQGRERNLPALTFRG